MNGHEQPRAGPVKRGYQWLYHDILGFQKAYNFPLFFIFGGALFGFSLARLQYLDFDGVFVPELPPGDSYWFKQDWYRIGLMIHLATILPCGLLAVLQFIPKIRHKAILFHRINGHIVLVLLYTSTVGALMIMRRSFGGDVSTRVFIVFLSATTLISAAMAYVNIKRAQIDQHRKWMLRSMFYMSTIVTLRIIMITIASGYLSKFRGDYLSWECPELREAVNNSTRFMQMYPECVRNPHGAAAVKVIWDDDEHLSSALRTGFGVSGWLATAIHMIGVEIYIRLTPAEDERLRKVSYERQLERGYAHPGNAGSTRDRLGDAAGAEWTPRDQLMQKIQSAPEN